MKTLKRKERRKKRNMTNETKTFEGKTSGKVAINEKADQEIKMVADENLAKIGFEETEIKKLIIQRNIALLAALLFFLIATSCYS